ncbi:MAG TPA: condensation domain-containing protein, partial [Puia sp.]|nr:condensation domain-containing protein [Puia sp.]
MENYSGLEIAVIGLACRYPKAATPEEYWDNLKSGRDCVSDFTGNEAREEGEAPEMVNNPLYVASNAYLESKENFDAAFFYYTPEEAELMDPQVRIFLECCWEALEDGGYGDINNRDKTGVFAAGTSNFTWEVYSKMKSRDGRVDPFTATRLSEIAYLSTRVSYKLNLKGPSVFMQTACSSSLVTIHEACNSLLMGECTMALAGGVSIFTHSKRGYLYAENMILSKDGRCRPFDASSSGTVSGEGSGVVLLKRLKDAISDGDNIYAIIRGSAVNNDGSDKVGYTAPGVGGQVDVIKRALRMAGAAPESISYVEAHGTATILGDPVELEALNEAFGHLRTKHCAIGSVKSNMGHLDSAAGIAGFMKTVLALKNRQIPASLHFNQPNPRINFQDGPFYVNNSLQEWERGRYPLRAGVSSFGIGGTNAHVILEEAPGTSPSSESRKYQLMVFSAKTKDSLERSLFRFAGYLKANPDRLLADVAYTLQTGRTRFKQRKVFVCDHNQQAIGLLSDAVGMEQRSAGSQDDLKNIVFLFSGQGSQYADMCKDLYLHEKIFKQHVDECCRFAGLYSEVDFLSQLFPKEETDPGTDNPINNTLYAQPLLFMVEYALARLLMSWGIRPDYMIGHSIGEYTAACISGVFTLEDALRIVVRRGELMSRLEKGAMLSISLSAEQLEPLLKDIPDVDIAVINSPSSLVVSGQEEDIRAFEQKITDLGFPARRVKTSHAFHSYMMESILDEFEREMSATDIRPPEIPYISNVTGEPADYEQISHPSYWSGHLRNTVQFSKGIGKLLSIGNALLIEIGPGRSLHNYVKENQALKEGHVVINTVRSAVQKDNDQRYLMDKLGQLWLNGCTIDWKGYYAGEKRKKVPLPAYSFDNTAFTALVDLNKLAVSSAQHGLPLHSEEEESFLHVRSWKSSVLPVETVLPEGESRNFLVFSGQETFSRSMIGYIKGKGHQVLEVNRGASCLSPDDLRGIWSSLEEKGITLHHILYNTTLNGEMLPVSYDEMEERLSEGYLGLSYLAQSLAAGKRPGKLSLTIFSNQLAAVTGEDRVDPLKAALHGPARIIPLEIPQVSCKVIDIPYTSKDPDQTATWVPHLFNELFYETDDPFISYRHKTRWTTGWDRFFPQKKRTPKDTIVKDGTYLITGGFGGMGFALANDLVYRHHANVIIFSRSPFPKRADWENWLKEKDSTDPVIDRIRRIQEMEKTGAHVDVYQVDVTREEQVRGAALLIKYRHPRINGLIWAAGEVDTGGIIQNRDRNGLLSYLSSKVHGVLLFEKYFELDALDFVALFASIGNVFYHHKFGQVAYNAANEFLENFSAYLHEKSGIHAFSINWCDWKDVGMTVRTIKKDTDETDINVINARIHLGLSPEEGVHAFYECLQGGSPVYTIYKGDLNAVIRSHHAEYKKIRENLLPEPSLPGQGYIGDNPEPTLLEMFGDFFGRHDLVAEDDFFELGGDSLKAMTLVARINRQLRINLTVGDIYKNPTARQLARALSDYTGRPGTSQIPRALPANSYPLSSAQKRMYFIQTLDRDNTMYNELQLLRVQGELDKQRLDDTFRKLIGRHEILRTSFIMEDDVPRQLIAAIVEFKIEFFPYKEDRLTKIIQSFRRPFDLSHGPLCRVGIISKTPEEHIMMIDLHHIVTDGVSQDVLIRDFMKLYDGATLPDLSLQYKDYAQWQQSAAQQKEMGRQKSYWTSEFAIMPPALALPTDPRPAVKSLQGASMDFILEWATTRELKNLAESGGASLFMTLLSIYTILLSKLCGQDDIVVGTPVAGRYHADLENVIGMFVNVLPMRNYPKEDLPFRDFLEEVKTRTLSCFDNQAYPYEELVNDLTVDRDASRNPLFDVVFVLHNFSRSSLDIPGLSISQYPVEDKVSKLDLILSALEHDGQLWMNFEYSTALFDRTTIHRFVTCFKTIIAEVLENPECRIRDINPVPVEERQRLLVDFNDTAMTYPREGTAADLFFRQAEKIPGSTAVVCGEERVSYQELSQRAEQIALR